MVSSAMTSQAVAVVGSANLDMVFRVPHLPQPGQTLLGGSFSTHPGGKGANQACAIAKLNGQVSFVGCVGNDANGAALKQALLTAGVGTEFLQVRDEFASGTAVILVDEDGRNQIVVAAGANEQVTPVHVRNALQSSDPSVVLCQLEIPLAAVVEASRFGQFILNPAPACELPDSILASTFVLTPNETEAESLTGIEPVDSASTEAAARALLGRGVANVVITLGGRGCYWASAFGSRHFPACPVQAVDTTAAGDAFSGALAHFIAQGSDLTQAIEKASRVAALATTKHGAMESMPTHAEFEAFEGTMA